MKLLPFFVVAGVLLATPSLFAAGESVQQILSDAQTAMLRNDTVTAKKNFEMVLQADPKNQIARNYLRIIAAQEAKAPKGSDTERQLATVIIPQVDFKEATLSSALEFLRQQVTKVSGGKTTVNFVVQLPEAQANVPVTLSVRTIPMTEVLRYIGDLAQVKFEYEKYAVKVKPAPGATVTAVAPAIPAAEPKEATIPGL